VYRTVVKLPDGRKVRISGVPAINTKQAALDAERDHVELELAKIRNPAAAERKEVPTYAEWFWGANPESDEPSGRFWKEWVIANQNKASERRTKIYIYRVHLKERFGRMQLNEIDAEAVASFRADLVEAKLSTKRINNILAVLSKSLRWAEEVALIDRAPRIRFSKVDRPEVVFYDFAEYARILDAATQLGPRWIAAVCLAGEAGLRVGEVKALRWREDIDLVAKTVTVNQQVLRGVFGTPKGRTRRTIPMTDRLHRALKSISTIREGLLLRNVDGSSLTDSYVHDLLYRTCRLAGLPERGWHILRHSFATHAAMFGINPWTLNAWMGHKAMEETMRYVHVAEHHHREIPESVARAGHGELDVTRRVIAMLGARGEVDGRGTHVAPTPGSTKEVEPIPLFM
jgi:integrase